MKPKPYPRTLPPMPKGQVYLGKGNTFNVPMGENEVPKFHGYVFKPGMKSWKKGAPGGFTGGEEDWHYCAPADSEVARLNGLAPAKKAPRKAAKKTKSIMSGFGEDVKPAPSPALVLEVGKTYLTRDGREARVIATDFEGIKNVVAIIKNKTGEVIVALTADGEASLSMQSPDDIISLAPDFDWSIIPAWHNHLAMEKDGRWASYGSEPHTATDNWQCRGIDFVYIPPSHAPTSTPSDWRQSLRVRPGYQPE